jgi:hypothetical protein
MRECNLSLLICLFFYYFQFFITQVTQWKNVRKYFKHSQLNFICASTELKKSLIKWSLCVKDSQK